MNKQYANVAVDGTSALAATQSPFAVTPFPWNLEPKKKSVLSFRIHTYWRKSAHLFHPPKKIFCQSKMSLL